MCILHQGWVGATSFGVRWVLSPFFGPDRVSEQKYFLLGSYKFSSGRSTAGPIFPPKYHTNLSLILGFSSGPKTTAQGGSISSSPRVSLGPPKKAKAGFGSSKTENTLVSGRVLARLIPTQYILHKCISCFNLKKLGIVLETFFWCKRNTYLSTIYISKYILSFCKLLRHFAYQEMTVLLCHFYLHPFIAT